MSSSLAKQLSALKQNEATQKRVDEYRQATVLYDRSEAAKIDIDHIQTLAIEGYQNLRQMNQNITLQEPLIFGNKGIDRFKLTEKENAILSENLKRLIRELSKSLLNTNTLKILEYLLRNYHVYQFEGEYLVEAFLAYHSTPQYIKLIQNVELSNKTSRFFFLNANSLSGHPISQEFLVRQFSIDPSLLEGYSKFVSEYLTDRQQAHTVFFVSNLQKVASLRSPAISFLLAMSELSFEKTPTKQHPRIRLVVLKLIKDLLTQAADREETFPAIILGLSTLITNRQLESSDFEAILLDIASKYLSPELISQIQTSRGQAKTIEFYKGTLAKVLILAFQHLHSLRFTREMAKLVERDLMEFILSSTARIVQLVLKYFAYQTAVKSPQIEIIKRLLKNILDSDQSFAGSESYLQRFLLICYQATTRNKSDICSQILKEVFGQIYYNALTALYESEGLSDDDKNRLESVLNESVLHRLIDGPHSTRLSLVTALSHHSKNVKVQALSQLLSSKIEGSNFLTAHLLSMIETSFDSDVLLSALQLPLEELSIGQQRMLFRKYLSVDDEKVHKRMRYMSNKLPELSQMFGLLDVALGKPKALKKIDAAPEIIISTVKTITDLASSRKDINLCSLGQAILASRQFGVFGECLKLMGTTQRIIIDLLQAFHNYLDLSLPSLDISELGAALKALVKFSEVAPESVTYQPKEGTIFIKMVLILLFSDEYSIENSTLQVVSQVLSGIKDLSLADIVDEEKFMLVLMLKGFKNEQFKNGHFLKILQTVRFATKKGSDTPGLHIYKHLLKRLLAKKFEFESGAFSTFEEIDLKSLHDFLSDTSRLSENKSFLKEFYTFCLNTTSYYPEISLFSKNLSLIESVPTELLSFMPEILPKLETTADFRQQLLRNMFDLFLKSSVARSSVFEAHFVKLRALTNVPFSYLASKSSYKGYLDLVEIYLESNFKFPGLISEVVLSPQHLLLLANNILSKQHEGLIAAFCAIFNTDRFSSSADIAEIGSIYLCYKGLQNYLLSAKSLKLETLVVVVRTLKDLHNIFVGNNPRVKVYTDTTHIKTKTIDLSLMSIPKNIKFVLQTSVMVNEDLANQKIILTEVLLISDDIWTFLERKSEESISKLVQLRGQSLLEHVSEEESLTLFTFIRYTIEYLISPHKDTNNSTEKYMRSILASFSRGLDSFKEKFKGESQSKNSTSTLDIGIVNGQTSISMITKLHHEIDYFIQKILKIIAEQSGVRKLRACSEVFFNWLILSENHRNNSLLKLLTNYYKRAEMKGRKDVNPLMDTEIHYYSNFIQTMTREIFGKENTDLVISMLIVLYMFKANNSELHFRHLSQFILIHLLNRQDDDPVVNCTHIMETLGKGIFNLKGLIPTNDKKAVKKPKAKIIRELLRRSDPLVAETSSPFEKVRSSRFSLIFLGLLNLTVRDQRFLKYIQGSVTLESADMQHSPLVTKMEYLLLEIFRFEVEFEIQEHSYSANAISKKPKLLALFSKIKKICARSVELIVQLIPSEIFPLALHSRLAEEKPDFRILLRLANAVHTKLKAVRPTKKFQEYYEKFLCKFVSMAGVFIQEQGAAHAIHKFIQATYVSFGVLFKRSKSFIWEFVNNNFSVLMEIMSKQTVFSVQMSCLANLACFSENLNDYFIAVLDDYVIHLNKVAIAVLASKNARAKELLTKTKLLISAKPKKGLDNSELRSFVTSEEIVQLWLQTFINLVNNLQNMMEPYLNKQLLLLAIICEIFPTLEPQVLETSAQLVAKLEERIILGPLTTVSEQICIKVLRTDECGLLHKILDCILLKVKRDDFVDFQETLFGLIRENLKYVSSCFKDSILQSTFERLLANAVTLVSKFALKSSENRFKYHFESLIKWSKVTQDYEAASEELMQRKYTMIMTLNEIVRNLGRFSINYYGHLFDYYVGFLEYCLNTSGSAKIGKRSSSSLSDSSAKFHSLILESLDLLFIHDKKGFVDTVRFERILKPLANQLRLEHVASDFFNYAQIRIIPTLLSLTSLVQDDFMWKSILFQICTQFRNPLIVVRKTITTTAMRLIDLLQDKFVIILNDFIPFLSEMLDDEEPEVCTIAKGIVKQLGQYSSEDIFALIKGSY